ncbi:MAG: 2,3-bisphosphoglycerate-independent phosphoglycerate mutase [Firmicutes bacterium]|nr:2,3-bisphosphoglycerate-independent phosphoglycerate mutase [Bacillota bacterium]
MKPLAPAPLVALIVLDGWGQGQGVRGNAVAAAPTPNLDRLFSKYPSCRLCTDGESVGQMAGQMGDSNVGHLNLGAGRIVFQDLPRIHRAVASDDFQENPVFLEAIERARARGSSLHLMGLVSDGGVHSHLNHLVALLELAARKGLRAGEGPQTGEGPDRVFIHAFLDGRDVPPSSGKGYLERLEREAERIGAGRTATVMGRYYAMDRDRRWNRTERAFRALVHGEGKAAAGALEAIRVSYAASQTDEFVEPWVVAIRGSDDAGEIRPEGTIRPGDSVIFFNFRADRARQITRALTDPDFKEFERGIDLTGLYFACMTEYDEKFGLPVAFPPIQIRQTLGEVVSRAGFRQLRIAETEKYAHVTYFFNGGREEVYPGEDRILVPSPKVSTYDQQPEMSAPEVTRRVLSELDRGIHRLVVLNFANLDMVGHTGDFEAARKAVETVDRCVGEVTGRIIAAGGVCIVTADHGNAEQMVDPETGEPHTAHTCNPVACIVTLEGARLRTQGILADIAPTVLKLLELPVPSEMTGEALLINAQG